MRVRIHRGAREIGGSCIELAHDGARLLLDLGLPLDGDPGDQTCYPDIDGLAGGRRRSPSYSATATATTPG